MSKQRRLDQDVNVSHKRGEERMRSFVSVNENFPSVAVSFKTRIELILLFEGDLLSVADLAWSRDVAVRRNFYKCKAAARDWRWYFVLAVNMSFARPFHDF